jgi:VanZ family protein
MAYALTHFAMLIALGVVAWIILAVFALRGARWAYAIFIILAFVWIPARTGFRLHRPPCDFDVTLDFSLSSLRKYKHVFLFGMFFLMTRVQLRRVRHPSLIAAAATLAMGVLIEVEEGATGTGYCKLVDLLPDALGALIGALIAAIWKRNGRQPVRS